MSRGNAKLEVGQLVLTSSTPPGNLGLYAYDQDTIGVVGDLVCIDPKSKAESSVVTSTVDPVTGGRTISANGSPIELRTEPELLLYSMSRGVLGALKYDYFVDVTGGNDTNDGLSLGTAWKTLSKISGIALAPAQTKSIFVKAGTYSTALDYVLLSKNSSAGAAVNIAFESGCVMDGTLANPGATSNVNGFEANGTSAWRLNIYGNGLIVRNYHDSSATTSPNGVGCHGYAQIYAYNITTLNCDDGFSAHDNTMMVLWDCAASGSEKGAADHVGSAYFEAHRCTFTGGGTLGIGGTKFSGVTQNLYDCKLIPTLNDEVFDGSNTNLVRCQIGNSTYRVKLTTDYAGKCTVTDSYLHLYQDGNAWVEYSRCYGKLSFRARPGAGTTVDHCVISGPATGKAAVLIADYDAGGSQPIKIKNSVFNGSFTFDSLTLAAYANYIFAADSEFRNNVLYGGPAYSALMTTANTNAGGTKISGTLIANPTMNAGGTYSQGDYAVTTTELGTDGSVIGYAMSSVATGNF